MTMPTFAGCLWPVDDTCCDSTGFDAAKWTLAKAMASASLSRLTGYRVTNCPVTVRPCKRSHGLRYAMTYFGSVYGSAYAGFLPYMDQAGAWVNFCNHTGDCSCAEQCAVELPGPVGRVDEVKVDGVVLSPTTYRLDGVRLIWTGSGACPWPTCQDLNLPDTEVGTFSVTYLNGYAPDSIAAFAAGQLACQFYSACTTGKCALPPNVVTVVRQGVSLQIVAGSFPGGMTGIREVDAFIALWNPKGRLQESRVWTPDNMVRR